MENKIELLELLYVYIDDIGRCFKNQEFIFTTEYDIKYNNDNNELKINKTEDKTYLKNFFGDNISNINIIAGKNGCGKSTLFNLLGCKKDDLDYIFNKKKSNDNWFCIYKTNIENNFFIEGYGDIVNKVKLENSNLIYSIDSEHPFIFYNYDESKKIYINPNINTKVFSKNENFKINREYINDNHLGVVYYTLTKQPQIKKLLGIPNIKFILTIDIFEENEDEDVLDNYDSLFNKLYSILEDLNKKNTTYDKSTIKSIVKIYIKLIVWLQKYKSLNQKHPENIENEKNFWISKCITSISDLEDNLQNLIYELENYDYQEKDSIKEEFNYIETLIEKIPEKCLSLDRINVKLGNQTREFNHIINIIIPSDEEFEYNIFDLLFQYQDGVKKNYVFNSLFKFYYSNNISEGEMKLLKIFSSIFYSFTKFESNQKTAIYILDEPELGFHPEWIRKFLKVLINILNETSLENIQILISTHSPFMLSDIPKEFITTIDIKEDKDGNHIRVVDKPKQSFASNYYDIIKDSFFLDNTMGEFALDKIRNIHEILYNSLSQLKNNKTITKQQVLDELNQKVSMIFRR